jgi:hypothetical protein
MKRGKGRGKKGNATTEVTVVSPAEHFANSLGMHVDSTCVRGKFLAQQVTNSTAVFAITTITPTALGSRLTACANIFSRWRIKRMILKINYSGLGSAVFGVLDDSTGEGDTPTSVQTLLELRTSATNFTNDPPTVLDYKPPTNEWYYTFVGGTGSDQRLVNAGVLYAGQQFATTNAVFTVEIDFSIVFKGAVDVGTSLPLPLRDPQDWQEVQPPGLPGKETPVSRFPAPHGRGSSTRS